MGHVGDKVFAHLLQLINARHIAHQHQVFVVAVAGDIELDAQVIVDRRGDIQRFAIITLLEVFLEARVAYQVGHWLAAVLWRLETQQGLCGEVPPLQVAVTVEHDHRVLERRRGLLHAIDHRLQSPAYALVTALQVVDAVEHLAPQTVAIGRCFVGFVLAQPLVQAQQLLEGPAQIERQANGQAPAVKATDQPDQQAASDQKQQMTDQSAMPVLIHVARVLACRWISESRYQALVENR